MNSLKFSKHPTQNGIEIAQTKASNSNKFPVKGNTVSILYKCRLSDFNTIVDQCEDKKEPFEFKIGSQSVIKGLDIGILSVQLGERVVFKLSPELAYGKNGVGPIPPNETLFFEAELINIK